MVNGEWNLPNKKTAIADGLMVGRGGFEPP